jgi:transcriptional regulator with XRE-family HTH domain
MKRESTVTKDNPVTAAVRKLRLGLDDSQQAFATRLGMAIATVVRYEHNRPPSGRALAKLERLAREHGFLEYAAVFGEALRKELGGLPVATFGSLECNTEEERRHVEALLSIFRFSPDSKQAAAIKRILKPQVDGARELRESDEALKASYRAVVRLLKAGRTLEETLKCFKAEHIADALEECGGRDLREQHFDNVVALLLKECYSIDEVAQRWYFSDRDSVVQLALERGLYYSLDDDENDEADAE